jgi:hypothetical protein
MPLPSLCRPSRAHQRLLAAWLTLLAMALVFLAPTVSRSVAFANGQALIACPMHLAMQMPAAGDQAPAGTALSVDACPLCVLAVGLPLPKGLAVQATLTRGEKAPRPFQVQVVSGGPAVWQPPPRGPPALA